MRLFVGVSLSEDLIETLARVATAIRTTDSRWSGEKWVVPANLHITLKFIGSVEEKSLDELKAGLAQSIFLHSSFNLVIDGAAGVPNPRRSSMLWATFLDPDGHCASLASAIERACTPFGVSADTHAFTPHATLCRARRPHAIRSEALVEADKLLRTTRSHPVSVLSATLFNSRLTSNGPQYERLAELPLSAT